MSSSTHLQCAVVQFSLTRLCKQLTVHQSMGDVSADAHPSAEFFFAQIRVGKPGILALLRNRLRLNDVTLSMSSLLVVLRDLSAWFSVFDTAHLTDLGSKTGCRRLTSLKMSKNLLVHHSGSKHSHHKFALT